MLQDDLIHSLKSQSTWRLLGLGVITFGVYYAHYIARQTHLINLRLSAESRISPSFITLILFLSYLTLGLFVGFLFVDDGHPIAIASNVLDRVWMLMILVWGFYARNRMNQLNATANGDAAWFSGLWTFLFSPLYFNYKINVLTDDQAQRVAA